MAKKRNKKVTFITKQAEDMANEYERKHYPEKYGEPLNRTECLEIAEKYRQNKRMSHTYNYWYLLGVFLCIISSCIVIIGAVAFFGGLIW